MDSKWIKKLQELKQKTIERIYSGKVTPFNPPLDIYDLTNDALKEAFKKGVTAEISFDKIDEKFISEMHDNIYFFSGAKDFQQVLQMSDALLDDDGNLRSFSDFKAEAEAIFDEFNNNWLRAEYNTANATARSAVKWQSIEANKKSRPYVQYKATEDEKMCEICGAIDGMIAPVDSPVWNGEGCVPQHFNCHCVLMSLDEDDADKEGGSWSKKECEDAIASQQGKNKLFNFNAGKEKKLFQDSGKFKHPYFEVSKKYKHLAEKNFNLPL